MPCRSILGNLLALLACLYSPARVLGWTPPIYVSDTRYNASVPRIYVGFRGAQHVVFHRTIGSDWRVCYRERDTKGNWGPIEVIAGVFSARPDVVEDLYGLTHVVYPGRAAGGRMDLHHAIKVEGQWYTFNLTDTAGTDEDYVRITADLYGYLHLVYTRSTGTGGTVLYRRWDGFEWSGEAALGSVGNPYYHRPDVAVDWDGVVHVTWIANGSPRNQLLYRSFDGGTWSGPRVIGTSTPGSPASFLSYTRIGAATPESLLVVCFDDNRTVGPPLVKQTFSLDAGGDWSAFSRLDDGHYPSLKTDYNGIAHLVYQGVPGSRLRYRVWYLGEWSEAAVVAPASRWQGWPDVAVDLKGNVYIVWDDDLGTPQHRIAFVRSD